MSTFRTRNLGPVLALATLATLLSPLNARADQGEWRFSLAGLVGSSSAKYFGAETSAVAFGGQARVGYGVTNMFEVGVVAGFQGASGLRFSPVTIQGQPGQLRAGLQAIETSLEVRFSPGVKVSSAFARVRPFLGLRGGTVFRTMSSPRLRDDQGALLFNLESDTSALPCFGGSLGLEWRISSHWSLSGFGDALYAGENFNSIGGGIAVSHLSYL